MSPQSKSQRPELYQLFEAESSTYTYILFDPLAREGVIIDSVRETSARDLALVQDLRINIKYLIETHVHADHVTGVAELKKSLKSAQNALSAAAGVACVEVPLEDGQVLNFGSFELQAIATPGHTDSCMSFYCEGMVFTGDALLVRTNGRTDFQQGSSEKLFNSITQKLFTLPDDTVVYPGHDYRGFTRSTIGLEKQFNARIGGGKTLAEFSKIMSELKLAPPKKIHEAVPANLNCGRQNEHANH